MNGVVILDKPMDFTSFDAVAVMRRLTGEKKIGHTGTLDPMATGVLPLLLGRAAKACDLLEDTGKEYRAEFRLGERRDTGDITGKVVETSLGKVESHRLEAELAGFRGNIWQTPPMYSAVSVNGQRLYKLARKGIEIPREKRQVRVEELELLEYDEKNREGALRVVCSKGTYIRTLIEDIAAACGSCAAMTALRRTRACGFSEKEALTLEAFRELSEKGDLSSVLRPVDSLFEQSPPVFTTEAQAVRFQNGGSLDLGRLRLPRIAIQEQQRVRVYSPQKQFLGLGTLCPETRELKLLKLFEIAL